MKLILTSFFIALIPLSSARGQVNTFTQLNKIELSRADHIIAEQLVNIIKLTEKGYISQDILKNTHRDTSKSAHFSMFAPWIESLQTSSNLTDYKELIKHCRQYTTKKETLPLEKKLERIAGNFCREKALSAVNKDIQKNKIISDESSLFIQEHLKFFLTKKNIKDFAFFVQSLTPYPEILKKISNDVTNYSVQNQIVPSQDVLRDIFINEQITKLIQDKGFNPLQHQNVFYAEYGKLIEMGYRSLDNKPKEERVKEHFHFLKNYIDLNQDHLPIGLCLSRLNDFSKAVFRNGFKDLSRDIFKFIIKKNHKDIHEDVLFFYLWTWMASNDWKHALKEADGFQLIKNFKKISDPRLRFWIAHAMEATGKSKDAIGIYEHIILNNPLSYYSIISTKKIQTLAPELSVAKFYTESTTRNPAQDIQYIQPEADHLSSLMRLKAWAKIDNQKMLNVELNRLAQSSMPGYIAKYPVDKQLAVKSELHLLNGRIIQESKNHLATFRYLYTVLDKGEIIFSRAFLEILYPTPYLDEVRKALKNDKIDPIVVLSLIRQESVFNPQARSPVGARGLMQLMPATARRMKKSVRDNQLVNPQLNIELGVKYFKNLHKRYDGNLVYVLGAYNAGEARIERWKNLYFDTDETILKNIEAIPFLETRNYVKLISRNIFFYKTLLEEKVDGKELNKFFDVHIGFNK